MNILRFLHSKPVAEPAKEEKEELSIKPIPDTEDIIYLDPLGEHFLRLDYPDEHEYKDLLEIVRAKIRSWMLMDIDLASSIDRGIDNSLSIKLATIDLKFLPKTGNWSQFLSYIETNPIYSPLTRLLDTINQISMEVPSKFLETLKGRFLYGMIYLMPKTCSSYSLPTKDEWVDVLNQMPWVFLLPIVQELYDTDKVIKMLNDKIAITKNLQENTVTAAPSI